MTIPFSEVRPQSLKVKVLPRYPALFQAGAGIAITQAAGVVTTSVDFSNLERDDISNLDGLYVGTWDPVEEIFKLVQSSTLKGEKGDPGDTTPASQAEAEAGVENTKYMSPLRTLQSIQESPAFVPSGTGKQGRSVVTVISDYSHSVMGQAGMVADGTDVTSLLNAWFADQRAGFLPPGRYGVSGVIQMPVNAVIEAPNWNAYGVAGAIIERNGVWAGPTLRFGTSTASCVRPTMRNIQIDQIHTGFNPGVSTSIPDRQTNDDGAHVEINGGSAGLFENNRLTYGRRHFDVKGGDNHRFVANHHIGYWDELNANLKETFSAYRFRNVTSPFNLGYATSHKVEDVQGWASFTASRTVTVGSVTFASHQGAGPRHFFEIYGCEDLQIRGGYVGGSGFSNFYIEPDGVICDAINVSDMYLDAAYETDFLVSAGINGALVSTLHIVNNRINGQQLGRNVMQVDKGASSTPVVYGLLFANNSCENQLQTPLVLSAVKGGLVTGNIFNAYHNRGGGVGNAAYSAGMLVSDVSRKVYSRSNYYGGGTTDFNDSSNTEFTAVWSGSATGDSVGDIDDTDI